LHTYGAEYASAERPTNSIRLSVGDLSQPLCIKPIGAMPNVIDYDPSRAVVMVGDGEFAPVSRDAWEYNVGGKNVIKSWFNYRKKDPGGKRAYPLDLVHPETWEPDWTTELIDLLTVLTRLTALEPALAELIARILDGPLLTAGALEAAGTRWPRDQQDRKPRYAYASLGTTASDGQLMSLFQLACNHLVALGNDIVVVSR
jgi:Type ISP C-terminal specificity domain